MMAKVKVSTYEDRPGFEEYMFLCPGCGSWHTINNRWSFNGDVDKPTFAPSVLVQSGHYAPHHKDVGRCWCTYNAECVAKGEKPAPFECGICHSFIRDGMIQFLSDCTHKLAGQIVELPEIGKKE